MPDEPAISLQFFDKAKYYLRQYGIFLCLLVVGIIVRIYNFGVVPLGLNQDEASMGYDAYSLLHYGIDRNGFPYPVHLVSWGSGMNALASYLAMPFIWMFGLSSFSIRLPALILGIISLAAFYHLVYKTTDKNTALLGLFFLAISPWHIMASRWALESNLFPPLFLLGTLCLAFASNRCWLFPAACGLFGLCFYAYGSAYIVVPVFLLLIAIFHGRLLPWNKSMLLGGFIFLCCSLPIVIFLLINFYHWDSVYIGGLSIPRLPASPRYEEMSHLSGFFTDITTEFTRRLHNLFNLLITQDDGTYYNVLPEFGYGYHLSMPFILLGIVVSILVVLKSRDTRSVLIIAWFAAALCLSLFLKEININRLNIIFFPLIFFLARGVASCRRIKWLLPIIVIVYFINFIQFSHAYFGNKVKEEIGQRFFDSYPAALAAAINRVPDGVICVTDHVNMPYIFALFVDRTDPHIFLESVRYRNPGAMFQNVISFKRFIFGLGNCPMDNAKAFVVENSELNSFLSPFYTVIAPFQRYSVVVHSE